MNKGDLKIVKKFKISQGFFGRYEELVKNVVIPYQEMALLDMIDDAQKSHCIENFRMASQVISTGSCDGEFYGMVFQDSDVAKWLEGAAYSMVLHPDKKLEEECDEIIEIIANAQHEDGYLNTYFTVKEPDKRWTNLEEAHELYCAGHMIEAGVAYFECIGKDSLLNVACKLADHIYNHFITENNQGYPGHPEIELALFRLYRCTNNEKYKNLAMHFINVRGVDNDFFIKESEVNNWTVWGNNPYDREYTQCHKPVREQRKAVGHAVRAVYLYTAMADAAYITNDMQLSAACFGLWENITQCRMYITGAIGSAYEGEAFTEDYHLPNDTAYAETCAAIGLIFFGNKLFKLDRNSKYGDIMERALYNCVLAGMQLDGKKFFYVNPLECLPGISGKAKTHLHSLPQRPKWFACACCPPNAARLIASIAEYAWDIQDKIVYSNLFIAGTLDVTEEFGGKITLNTKYPYEGELEYVIEGSMEFTLAIRIPNWSNECNIMLNDNKITPEINNSIAYIKSKFNQGDVVKICLDMSVKKIYPSTKISADSGKIALQRGPLVYCAEGVDNNGDVLSLRLSKNGKIEVGSFNENTLNGIIPLYAEGERIENKAELYSFTQPRSYPEKITYVPYYAWGNRGENQMRVWIDEI